MSGTSKAVLSMCVLLLAALVVYYGMTPQEAIQPEIDILPKQRPTLFGGDPEEKMIALGYPPVATSLPEVTTSEELVVANPEITRRPTSLFESTFSANVRPEPSVVEVETKESEVIEEPIVDLPALPIFPKEVKIVEQTYKIYTVKDGETLGEIATREMGSFKMWRDIATLNNITDPSRIMPGRVLRMPTEKIVKVTKPVIPRTPLQSSEKIHIVVDGDTMSSIAGDYYDDVNKYGVIVNANPKVDPNRLIIGTTLTIPKL